MLYQKDKNTELTAEEFADPPAQFRGAPFWAWNTELNEEDLLWQIERLKEMGFGGFFIHTRSGMNTEYLGKEFMRLVCACNKKAKETGLYSYLYDEDRWPSGAAGGYVTENKAYRQKMIVISHTAPDEMQRRYRDCERDPELLAVYDINFDGEGKIIDYVCADEVSVQKGERWYAYRMLAEKSGWYNGFTYLDTMNPDAVDKFIEVTHEAYRRELGEEFGKSVPAIFTDEPSYYTMTFKGLARDGADAAFPWTQNFSQEFNKRYGYNILSRFPEVVWEKSDRSPNTERYRFFATATELFASNFSDRIGKWCRKNHIAFTGHYMEEPFLLSQMRAIGEAMRHYREFDIPGIDMLCNRKEFTTVKQAQSAVHQFGREGMMCELYGVTGWDYDFRGHKFQGDWQAALGVTLRVPHLAWVSMRGSAKRDYPASIGYQSSWFQNYNYIENHFARINSALTRGKPLVNVAVLHPIESAWMTVGVREHTATASEELDEHFQNVTEWLLRGQLDFDFFSESMLTELYRPDQDGFCLGEMSYRAVVVPPVVTVRSTTLKALDAFLQSGGKVIVCGGCPPCVDGEKSDAAKNVWEKATCVNFSQTAILKALKEERVVEINGSSGIRRKDIIYSLREEKDKKWLFLAHCDDMSREDGNDCAFDTLRVCIKGLYRPKLYDTLTGEIKETEYVYENGNTVIFAPCYPLDSFLYELVPNTQKANRIFRIKTNPDEKKIHVDDAVSYCLSEPNVLVLDMPEWSCDGKIYHGQEEMLRIDGLVRKELGYTPANGLDVQPWRLSSKPPKEFVWLRFLIESEIAAKCLLGYEFVAEAWLNGENIVFEPSGYFVDKEIHTLELPHLKQGKNELIVRVPISERISLENMFLLGDFGVSVLGRCAKLIAPASRLAFDSFTKQGLPFYGANVTYEIPFECSTNGVLSVITDYYIGALISVKLDGAEVGKIVIPPYRLEIEGVTAGAHTLELTLCGTRGNTFGPLHLTTPMSWKGPDMWYTNHNMWSYEYRLHDMGIMKKPVLSIR